MHSSNWNWSMIPSFCKVSRTAFWYSSKKAFSAFGVPVQFKNSAYLGILLPPLLNRFMRWFWWIWLPFSPDAVPGLPALGRRSSVLGLLQPYSRSRQTSPKQYLIRTVIQLEKETLPSLSIPIWTGQILRFFKKFLKTFSEPLIRGQRVKGRNLLPSLPIPFWTA